MTTSAATTPGALIADARKKARLSLRKLGVAAGGYSPQYMNDLEQNRRRLAPQRWHYLLRALPTLNVRLLAEAYLATGPVELDASVLTPRQRATLLDTLMALAERPAARGGRSELRELESYRIWRAGFPVCPPHEKGCPGPATGAPLVGCPACEWLHGAPL